MTLGLSNEEASELHHKYYTTYGLALRGLIRHHDVGEVPSLPFPPSDP
jgi:pyrimidine and pyridine-specific 5'-nucleotidase